MARFYYARTHKVVEIDDDIADQYDGRRHYRRLEPATRVPEGTVAEILKWVGDNPVKRRLALEAEQAGKQRTTLLDALAQD